MEYFYLYIVYASIMVTASERQANKKKRKSRCLVVAEEEYDDYVKLYGVFRAR